MDVPKTSLDPAAFAMSALRLNLYQWQTEYLQAVGKGFQSVLCAPNGSGKSSVVLAAAIIWFLHEFPRGRCIVTSGSWTQLTGQLFDSLHHFSTERCCRSWTFLEAVVRTPEGGGATGLSVAEAERVEGWHPKPEIQSPTMLVMDEGKTIDDHVYVSLDKCRWSYRLVASSAGPAKGRFWRYFQPPENKFWYTKRVTYTDCPHLDERQRLTDMAIYGEASAFYRTRWLSVFATDAGKSMIPIDSLRALQASPPVWRDQHILSGGCDFAASEKGDKNVFVLARGNRLEIVDSWQEANPKDSAQRFIGLFKKYGLRSDQISGDASGLGIGFVWDLKAAGYTINPIKNDMPATEGGHWLNFGVEIWDKFSTLVLNRSIVLPGGEDGEELIQQLSNREKDYKNGKLRLESKKDMKSRGTNSPDFADAAILAMMTGSGWGHQPSNLCPQVYADQSFAMEQTLRRMERNRSPFYEPPQNWDFL